MRTVGVVGIVLFALCGTVGATVIEDFESYPLHTWPSPGWTPDAMAVSDPGNNRVELDPVNPSNQVLKLYGATGGGWAALAYYPTTFSNEFFLEASVYNGSEDVGGAGGFRGIIGMRTGTSWWSYTNPVRELMAFRGDGTLLVEDNGTPIGTYNTNQWYDVAIHYQRNVQDVALQYWLDGTYLGEWKRPIWDQSVESGFDHLEIDAGRGTVYYDNISLYSFGGSGPVTVPAPGAALLGLMGATVVGWLRRRATL